MTKTVELTEDELENVTGGKRGSFCKQIVVISCECGRYPTIDLDKTSKVVSCECGKGYGWNGTSATYNFQPISNFEIKDKQW